MKTKQLTLGGILVALTLIFLYIGSILPTNRLTFLTLASCLIPIAIISISPKASLLIYFGSFLLGVLILPKSIIILYGLFFGFYGIIKNIIEKKNNLPLEILFKLTFLNISLILIYFLGSLILGDILNTIPIWLFWIISQVAFLIYDYALTLIISFYVKNLAKHINKFR